MPFLSKPQVCLTGGQTSEIFDRNPNDHLGYQSQQCSFGNGREGNRVPNPARDGAPRRPTFGF